MSSIGSRKHTHRYMKVDNIWYCSLSDCTHYMPRNMKLGILGKKSICWNCGDEFILDERAMKDEKPICFDCTPEGKLSDFDMEEFERLQRAKKLMEHTQSLIDSE